MGKAFSPDAGGKAVRGEREGKGDWTGRTQAEEQLRESLSQATSEES